MPIKLSISKRSTCATKKLYAKLPDTQPQSGITPAKGIIQKASNLLSGWLANLVILQRRNCLLIVHHETRFPLFIKSLLKADFVNFDQLFADVLMNTLLTIEANQDQLDTAASLLEPCHYETGYNRSVLGTMNQMVSDIEYGLLSQQANINALSSYRTGARLAERPCTVKGQKDSVWPKKAMLSLLDQAAIKSNN